MPDSKRFLRPEAERRIRQLELRARRAVEGFLSGMHRSPYFGQSVEFLQHRPYAAGDDLRHIDWKVWARQDRLHIKQYEEETNLRCSLIVDASASMRYGTGDENKFGYAGAGAVALTMLLLRQQDAPSLITFSKKIKEIIPPRTHRGQLDRILAALGEADPTDGTDLIKVLREAAETLPKRGIVVLFSDLLGTGESMLEGVGLLRQRGQEVIVMHLLHRDEVEFPFDGATRFEGLESADFLNCNPRTLREEYLAALQSWLDKLRRSSAQLGVDYRLVKTYEPLGGVLAALLASRQGLGRSGRR
jgi:uncharacterized protein (DUF58 family)